MIRLKSGEVLTNYFDRFKSARVNEELSKGKLTKHEEQDKAETDYSNNTNPEKVAKDKFLAMYFLECDEPVRYNTLWSSIINNYLTGADHYPRIMTISFNLIIHNRTPVTHTIPQDGGVSLKGKNIQLKQV